MSERSIIRLDESITRSDQLVQPFIPAVPSGCSLLKTVPQEVFASKLPPELEESHAAITLTPPPSPMNSQTASRKNISPASAL
jgi:hypothetical protein